MNNISNQYLEYAFIDNVNVGEGEAVAGAMTYMDNFTALISRTYEEPLKWYFVVYKPYNRAYEKQPDWFQARGIDRVRKSLQSPAYILTRELLAEKTHINALFVSEFPPKHESDLCNKYKLHVSELKDIGDRQRVLSYITKEAKDRPYVKYQDYIISK